MKKQFQTKEDILYPEIFLAIDNCFASKRYTEPDDWMNLIRDLGVSFIEASADTECDPLYMGREYLRKWVDKAFHASVKYGVSICNLYSGHGTYSTLGLSHTDPIVRDRILNGWLKPMVETAAALDAGLGFFCHAFPNSVLQNPDLYLAFKKELLKNLAETAQFARVAGCKTIGVEQMYSPHQIPWTIKGARDLMNQIFEKSVQPMYITIDTGHQSGQGNFMKPKKETLIRAMEQYRENGQFDPLWLGPDAAYRLFETCNDLNSIQFEDLVSKIHYEMKNYPYLFSEAEDGSPYRWLEELACYSPVIHLQQTDGTSSGHWPFTRLNNEKGIIEGRKVLEAIKTSYENQHDLNVPKVDRIYLTIEVFASTGSMNYFTIRELQETIRYWRKFIPEDGKRLNELV
jgi:sugar phosphate isomerase/epimerase